MDLTSPAFGLWAIAAFTALCVLFLGFVWLTAASWADDALGVDEGDK